MASPPRDDAREQRTAMEIVADCYGPEEQAIGRPELLDRGGALAAASAARAAEAGEYRLHPLLPPGVGDPTLFQGTAGIGYELLRLAGPGALPSVLLLE